MSSRARAGVLLTLALGFSASALASQAQAQSAGQWERSWRLGSTLFFGSTSQYDLASGFHLEWAEDTTREFNADVDFLYGEATSESGDQYVNKRSWRADASYDRNPIETFTEFAFGSYEESLEQRIGSRIQGGIGSKWAIVRHDSTRVDSTTVERRLDLSLAGLVDRTVPRTVGETLGESSVIWRASLRFRHRRDISDENFRLDTVVFYRPEIGNFDNYTVSVRSTAGLRRIGGATQFTITLDDAYDSLATDRGSSSNHTGRLSFGLERQF